ncbi:hypothetical protein SALBM311S_10491 [Streptomyces alboniger]
MRGGRSRPERDRRDWLRGGAPPPGWARRRPAALRGAVCAATRSAPTPSTSASCWSIPPLAVLSYGPMATAVLGGLVLAVLNIPVFHLNDPGSTMC